MPALALALLALYAVLVFGVRVLVQLRRTGSTGVHGIGRGAGPLEWLAGAALVIGVAAVLAAPLLALLDAVEPIAALDRTAVHLAGTAIAAIGIVATFAAQLAMGDSWRIGVEPSERTALVVDGPFALVRNPIYAAMLPTMLGLALLVPSWVACAGFACIAVALELQVRMVEEPYLLAVHGASYATYAARVGRFVPAVGRLAGVAGYGPRGTKRETRRCLAAHSAAPRTALPLVLAGALFRQSLLDSRRHVLDRHAQGSDDAQHDDVGHGVAALLVVPVLRPVQPGRVSGVLLAQSGLVTELGEHLADDLVLALPHPGRQSAAELSS